MDLGKLIKGDKVIWIVMILLSCISFLAIYSATGSLAYREAGGNENYYLLRQIKFVVLGFVAMVITTNIPTKIFSSLAKLSLIISILLVVIAFALKGKLGGSGRTLLFFQPSEIAKIGLILFVSRLLTLKEVRTQMSNWQTYKEVMKWTIISFGVIMLSDFSTASILFATIFVLMFLGRINKRYLALTAGVIFSAITIVYVLAPHTDIGRFKTVRSRIDSFFTEDVRSFESPEQEDFAEMAIYNGRNMKGPGQSTISNIIAAGFNDFIFAIFVEEYGIIGAIVLLILYIIFFSRCGVIIQKCDRTFSALITAGFAVQIILQTFSHIFVSVGLFPVTGQTLPFVSLGGTSLVFLSICVGIILRVSYQNELEENHEKPQKDIAEDIPDDDMLFEEIRPVEV